MNMNVVQLLLLIAPLVMAIDNFPQDKHLDHLKINYQCFKYTPDHMNLSGVTISLTSIPPRFDYLHSLSKLVKNNQNVIVNIPLNYRYFQQSSLPNVSGLTFNLIKNDLGPGNKLMGLCENLKLVHDLIIYLDDDVEYDQTIFEEVKKHMKLGYMVGGHGGFYTGIDDPNLSFLGYGYFNQRYAYKPCYIKSQVLMGFGGVAILKYDLIKLCNSPSILKYTGKKSCYFIDDDWISRLAHEEGLFKIAYLPLIMSRDVVKSEMDGWSNRELYFKSRKDCLSESPVDDGSASLKIVSALIESHESLHKISEYKSIKKLVRMNHYNFVNSFKHDYKLYHKTKYEKSHWVKIEIMEDFLNSCKANDILFYTDYDFLFLNNIFPKLYGSMIMNKGCSYDDQMTMVGTLMLKCDRSIIEFLTQWHKLCSICAKSKIKNDDQIAFNLIKYDLASRLQIVDFYRYDICEHDKIVTGLHFPGANKYNRMMSVVSLYGIVVQ